MRQLKELMWLNTFKTLPGDMRNQRENYFCIFVRDFVSEYVRDLQSIFIISTMIREDRLYFISRARSIKHSWFNDGVITGTRQNRI